MTNPAIVRAYSLGFRYPSSGAPVVSGLDLEVTTGEMVAVVGPSGSGKSTLLYLLGLFLHPSVGALELLSVDTTQLADRERSLLRAHRIGFVLQDAALHHDMTLLSNVADGGIYCGLTRSGATRRAAELLERYGLSDVANRSPAQVSGGQAQRAALCRALIRQPPLILADEPTGNLDEANARSVIAGLRGAAEAGASVVVVTHAPAVAAAADRVVALRAA